MTVLLVTKHGLMASSWQQTIKQRDQLLVEADQLVNKAEDTGLNSTPFRQYRQALRDIPQTYNQPDDVVWPRKPSLPQASS